MIREINEEQVSPEEQLSDYAHVYDQAEKKIVMCKDFEARSIEHRRPDGTLERRSKMEIRSDMRIISDKDLFAIAW